MSTSLWLLPTVRLSLADGDAVFYDGFKQLKLARLGDEMKKIVRWLDGNHGQELLAHAAGKKLVELLDRQGWIVRLERPIRESMHEHVVRTRQLAYFAHLSEQHPDRAFEELAGARVLIIGAGGIGSYAAFHLAACGVRKFVLNDFDRVEPSNLNRQILFSRADLGREKVQALGAALAERFEHVEVEAIADYLHYDALCAAVKRVDLVLLCGEHPLPLDRPSVIGDCAIITAGYFGCEAFAGPVVSPRHGTPRWSEVLREGERHSRAGLEQRTVSLSNNWNSSGATNNAMGGALLGEAALRLLAPSLGGPILLMTRRLMNMRTLTLRDESFELGPAVQS